MASYTGGRRDKDRYMWVTGSVAHPEVADAIKSHEYTMKEVELTLIK